MVRVEDTLQQVLRKLDAIQQKLDDIENIVSSLQ